MDWSDTGKALLAIGHESGGKLMFTEDAGNEWKALGTKYWAVGLFDHQTLLGSIWGRTESSAAPTAGKPGAKSATKSRPAGHGGV